MSQPASLYADLSAYYDLFCAEVDYEEQCLFTRRAFDCFASSGGQRYLDLACGTGAHIHHMQSYGFQATGLDNSADMLQQAALRCPHAALILSDMSAFQAPEPYDLISCFLYSIHYSHPVSSLKQTLQRVYDALRPGGVFVFNTVDIRGITGRHFVTTRVRTDQTLLSFSSGWTYAGQGEAMLLQLSISEQRTEPVSISVSEPVTKPVSETAQQAPHIKQWRDTHTMTAMTIEELRNWLQGTGFEVTLLEHDYSRLQPWSGSTFNVIVVAGKPR